MPITNIGSIVTQAIALKLKLVNLPRPQRRVYEIKMFVSDYNILSGGVDWAPENNSFRVTILGGEIKEGRQFEDIADYSDYVIGVLADETKAPGWRVNALFCFHYAFTLHYMRQKPYPKEYDALYLSIHSLIEEAITNSPKKPLYMIVPFEGQPLSETVKKFNCVTLTDRIFRDIEAVNHFRKDFWPHCQEGLYKMNICGGIILKNPIR